MVSCTIALIGTLVAILLSTLSLYGDEFPVVEGDDDVFSLDSLLSLPINTVSKSWQTLRVAPASVTIITARDIERFGYRTVEDVVRTARGFYTNYDRSYSYIGVRGFSRLDEYNSRLLVLLNGHSLNENVTGAVGVGYDLPLNFETIERIEIVRGPGSVVYGTGAMFAVINIITKNGKALDGIGVSGEVGSFGYRQVGLWAGTVLNDVDLTISGIWGDATGQDLYFPEYDTATTNFGVAQNLDGSSHYSIAGKASYGLLALQGYASFRQKSVPTAPYGTVFNYSGTETIDKYALFEASYGFEVGDGALVTLRGNYNTFSYRENAPYEGDSMTIEVYWAEYQNRWVGGEARLQWDIYANDRLMIGAEYKNNTTVSYNLWLGQETLLEESVPFSVWSVYIRNEYQIIENLNLTAAMRLDHYPESGTTVSPKVSAIFNATPTTVLKFLYGTGFRTPSYNNQYVDDGNGGRDTLALETERVRSWEVVVEQQIGRDWYVVGSVYDNHIKNVYKEFLSEEEKQLPYWPLTSVRAVGAEVEVNVRLASELRGYSSYSLQTVWNGNDKGNASNSPIHVVKLGLSHTVLESLTLSVEALYESSRYTVYNTTTNGYALATAHVAYRPLTMVEVSVIVRNILNTHYALPGSLGHEQASIMQDGRNAIAKIRFEL